MAAQVAEVNLSAVSPEPAAKRIRTSAEDGDVPGGGGRGCGLTDEQRARIEQNRLRALERRRQQQEQQQLPTPQQQAPVAGHEAHQPMPLPEPQPQHFQQQQELLHQPTSQSPPLLSHLPDQSSQPKPQSAAAEPSGLSAEQLKIIAQNRQAALERRQRAQRPTPEDAVLAGKVESSSSCAKVQASHDGDEEGSSSDSESASSVARSSSCSSSSSGSDSASDSDSDESSADSASESAASSGSARQAHVASSSSASCAANTGDQPSTVCGLSAQQRARIEENRLAALSRRRAAAEKAKVRRLAAMPCLKVEKAKEEKEALELKRKKRNAKEQLVAKVLCRWWYVLPPWPPEEDAYYEPLLEEKRLRVVEVQRFEFVPEVDDLGFTKVFPVKGYKGLFRDAQGQLVDLRPKETCPSYNNMMSKSVPELHGLLIQAYAKQMAELEAQPVIGPDAVERRAALQQEVKEAKHKAGFALYFMPKMKDA